MKRNVWRQAAAVAVLLITVAAFAYYFAHHAEVRQQLGNTSPGVILAILALDLLGIGALAMVAYATVRLCKINLGKSESLLLTAYSSVVNFFGPLQSGPAFRAIYLKKKHHLNIKNYAVATLVYYFFYGSISGLFLLSGLLKWWLVVVLIVVSLFAVLAWRTQRFGPRLKELNLSGWHYLALATLLQIIVVTCIYYVELINVAPGTHFSQAVIYSGAANLALFVSFTPGAIGFRESFLLFSQNLHHISSETIVAANILDRAMYIILLLILTIFIFGTHAERRLRIRSSE